MQTTDIPAIPLAYFDPGDNRRIAYRQRKPDHGKPTVLFLPGYASDMEGAKATTIDLFCASRGVGCLRMDYSGTGSSGGEFGDGTLDRWLNEVLSAIDFMTDGEPIVIAGSSMGGWLAFHAALQRPDRVKGLVGIAAAPDFTDWGFSAEEKQGLDRGEVLERANPYGPEPMRTYPDFWKSGLGMRLLYNPIDLNIPVRLVHGEKDTDVPMGVPIKLMDDLRSSDVQLNLIKNGGHRLSEPHEIHAILVALVGLLELIAE
nr:alpha/beta hydrolase [uncultured Sphingomonas sp.]